MLCLSVAVVQSPFTGLASLRIDKRHLLNAWMIIPSDNDHVRLLLPNLPSSKRRQVEVRVGMEATGHARWSERLLAELKFELWIGDPARIKAARVRKQD
jgi:hypothetical protein